ncbi:cyclopropane-fatty-acyl-phospholipid synthase family protein [Chromobacterium sp. IIBBL 290-4]|uniref:SAM-dependent methyltransferase n=1 Tax=Chromobacterium sp. IIBBL 290-4 TaxID=2953890 RepID=UPI0020B70A38|nr:class I SAM-dependent methyltransferase [Chromobacterium sp. IIBBL 290-4]UTH74619.1 methyltransferase domain-containing protein [Chromobacterium sp. IIBBL 290-4]
MPQDELQRWRWEAADARLQARYLDVYKQAMLAMPRQGPGSPAFTQARIDQVLRRLRPQRVLEVACGNGETALLLAKRTDAQIIATDLHAPFIDKLRRAAKRQGLNHLETRCIGMDALDYPPASFDLIWAEGCAHLIGVERALGLWRPLLSADGLLFLSEPVWLTGAPSAAARTFWHGNHPGMLGRDERESGFMQAGWRMLERSLLPAAAWRRYYAQLERVAAELAARYGAHHPALADIAGEAALYRAHGQEYGLACWLLAAAR